MSIIGYILYEKYTYKWILLYSNLFAILFLILNVVFPEVHDKTLAPALQSVWFPPHVVIYIISYSLLGASFIIAIKGYYYVNKKNYDKAKEVILVADNIVESGFCLLTLGLIFGAFWAKQAWGHYWTWDPKETWALLTWLIYLIYIHLRYNKKENIILPIILLIAAFLILLTAWFGINYLPSSQGSIHTYNS